MVSEPTPEDDREFEDEFSDGPPVVGIMLIAGFLSLLIFGAGIYVGFTANVDRWFAALKGMGL
jgi:hypothetical protein